MLAPWAMDEVAGAKFGDKRLDVRFAIVLSELGDRPILSIPAACGGRAEMKAAYRFFDNGKVSHASGVGDDWYRLDFKGAGPSLLTAQLSMPNPMIAHRVRCYRLEKAPKKTPDVPGNLPVAEYRDGADGTPQTCRDLNRRRFAKAANPGRGASPG